MHTYAQTNVQLFNQLRSEGYSKPERQFVLAAYEFGMRLFTGLFLPSGKPFIDHLVGTASVLASLHMPVEVVTAGLIHAAYLHGDFGGARKGISKAKQKQVRDAVGEEVEEYVARYDGLHWNRETMLHLHDALDELGLVDRNVLLMRLANELEHRLDLGVLYFPDEKQQRGDQRYIDRYGPMWIEMAEKLGFLSLASGMAATFKNITSAELPIEPCIRTKDHVAYRVVARSYRERFWVTCSRRVHRLLSKILNIGRRLFGKLPEPMRDLLRTAFQLAGIK